MIRRAKVRKERWRAKFRLQFRCIFATELQPRDASFIRTMDM